MEINWVLQIICQFYFFFCNCFSSFPLPTRRTQLQVEHLKVNFQRLAMWNENFLSAVHIVRIVVGISGAFKGLVYHWTTSWQNKLRLYHYRFIYLFIYLFLFLRAKVTWNGFKTLISGKEDIINIIQRSIGNDNIPPEHPPGIWTFEK